MRNVIARYARSASKWKLSVAHGVAGSMPKRATGWLLISLSLLISGCASLCPAPPVQTKVIHQTIPDDLLPYFVMPVWYPGGGNEAFVDYIERTEERARKHNATIDAAREANQQRPDAAGVSKP